MSDIVFPCSKCGKDIQVDEQFKGQNIVCPICHVETIIPLSQPKQTRLSVAAHDKPAAPPPSTPHPLEAAKKKGGTALDKTVATARRRKMMNVVIVIILLIALPTIGFFFFPDLFKSITNKYHSMRGETNLMDTATNSIAIVTNTAPVAPPLPPPEWNIALNEIEMPTNKMIGMIMGKEFRVDVARLDRNILYLRQGTNAVPEMEFQVWTGLRANDTLDGKSWNIPITQKSGALTVVKRWTPNPAYAPKQQNYSGGGYALRLEFGTPKGGKTPGKIYLSIQDPEKSFVAGSFEAVQAPPVTPPNTQPGATANPAGGPQGGAPRGLTPAQRAASPATSPPTPSGNGRF